VIDASPWLVEELVEHRMRSKFTSPTDLVFATRNRTRRQRSNISRQILAPAIEAADKKRAKEGRAPITKVTNHSLRRTFCALLYEAGATPPSVMAQMGHTDAKLALEVYAKVMERKRDTGARMDALVRGPVLAGNGSTAESVATIDNAAATKKPLFPAAS
jgi:integrase